MLELANRIVQAYKGRGLVTAFIYGRYADGKTSYLLHAAREAFGKLLNLKHVDAWLMALDHLYFHPVEAMMMIETFRTKNKGDRVVLLGMDDVGQHLPRARWWREDVVQFREWMSVARTDCSAVLFTAPTQLSLPGGIIDSCFLRLKVERHPERRNLSLAKGYEIRLSPRFQEICSGPVFIDEFPRHYPDFVFEEYENMRERMVAPLRRHLMSLMGEDKVVEGLAKMGATQKTIGSLTNKTQQSISYRLKNKSNKNQH